MDRDVRRFFPTSSARLAASDGFRTPSFCLIAFSIRFRFAFSRLLHQSTACLMQVLAPFSVISSGTRPRLPRDVRNKVSMAVHRARSSSPEADDKVSMAVQRARSSGPGVGDKVPQPVQRARSGGPGTGTETWEPGHRSRDQDPGLGESPLLLKIFPSS